MLSWTHCQCISPPAWIAPLEPIQQHLQQAFTSQRRIGWDQFFRGRLSRDWQAAIASYYRDRRPGESFTPDKWMRSTIDAIWTFAMTLWRQRNAALHGEDGALTMEQRRKDAAARATEVYRNTIGNVSPSDGLILHRAQISEILNWTQQHLDAYLATAEVVCEWNVEPG
jgi:hypothetical protein